MKVHFIPLAQLGLLGSQVLRQTPGACVPAHTLPGAHPVEVEHDSPVAADPAGQTQEAPCPLTT
jgi:hypothetical protein